MHTLGSSGADLFAEIIKVGTGGGSPPELQQLLSVWYYTFHSDNWVRRGDIVEIGGEMGLVVTPACDLANFPRKAGCRLTWLRIKPFTGESLNELSAGTGLRFSNVGASIVAQHGETNDAIVLLPNMPGQDGTRDELEDHMILCHAWETTVCAHADSGRLTYARIPDVRRRCTLAEPFVSAAIARAAGVITSPAVPDLPQVEKDRLTAIGSPKRAARIVPDLPTSPAATPPAESAAASPEGAVETQPAAQVATEATATEATPAHEQSPKHEEKR